MPSQFRPEVDTVFLPAGGSLFVLFPIILQGTTKHRQQIVQNVTLPMTAQFIPIVPDDVFGETLIELCFQTLFGVYVLRQTLIVRADKQFIDCRCASVPPKEKIFRLFLPRLTVVLAELTDPPDKIRKVGKPDRGGDGQQLLALQRVQEKHAFSHFFDPGCKPIRCIPGWEHAAEIVRIMPCRVDC